MYISTLFFSFGLVTEVCKNYQLFIICVDVFVMLGKFTNNIIVLYYRLFLELFSVYGILVF